MLILLQDLRFAIRQLSKSRWFAVTAILTLALGIGANTAVFSVLNALLLKLLPLKDPQHIFTVLLVNGGTQPPNTNGTGHGNTSFSFPVYEALRTQHQIFSDLIAHVPLSTGKLPVRYGDASFASVGEEVSGNYFSGLGVPLIEGTGLNQQDETNHTARVVLSYAFWTQAFSRSPAMIGQTLYIKGIPFTIAGVTAHSFFGVEPGTAIDFWIPLQTRPELNAWGAPAGDGTLYNSPNWWALPMTARLAPGVSPVQAQLALQPLFWHAATASLGTLDPKQWPATLGFRSIQGLATYAKSYREPVEIMMVLVGLVLLIACTNVALLILARNARRQREFALRLATGARPMRIFRQLLTESLLLVSLGTALGWLFAILFTRALAVWAKLETGVAPDLAVLSFTLVTATVVALAFSLAPLRGVFQISLEHALRNGRQGSRRVRNGNLAIAFQIALCFTLLVAAGLTLRTLLNFKNQDLGMRADQLLVFDLNPPGLNGNVQVFYDRLLSKLQALPGVTGVSLIHFRPGSGWLNSGGIRLDGRKLQGDSRGRAEIYSNLVGPEFFSTMGIPVLQGRGIDRTDTATSQQVVVVNEEFARRFLPTGALGHQIDDGNQIIGVVENSKYRSVNESAMPTTYYALAQRGTTGQVTVEVRTSMDPMVLLPQVQRAVHDLGPDLVLLNPMKQSTQFEKSYLTTILFARLALTFGGLAIVLVATGLYGTLVYRLQRRRPEIGIRMALGAQRGRVLTMIIRESLVIGILGLGIGLPLSLAVGWLLRSQLYQLSALDSISYASAAVLTVAVALLAALLPAHQASQIEPMEAIRTD